MTWLGALTNTALVFLFRQRSSSSLFGFSILPSVSSADASPSAIMTTALLLALTASHVYMIMRTLVRHILVRALWDGSAAAAESERVDEEVKSQWLKQVSKGIPPIVVGANTQNKNEDTEGKGPFWVDQGLDEIKKVSKHD